ncbi:MAG TPA: DNA mismatch repair protein MutS [Candidatus Deferrimicrobiaceae bacterium]
MTLQLTPAMRQYVEIKSRYRDCILFFRMGDFYEMFFEDAIRASRLLDIALTTRDKESNIPMCGVPHHARNAYLSKLIRQGCKVAICEQIEEPGQKGIFRREVTEVVTPGLVFSEECLDARGNNFLAAVRFRAPFAYAALDATTGEFFHETCDTEEALADALFRIAPAEFVALEGEGNPATGRGKRLLDGKLLTLLSPTEALSFAPPAAIDGVPPGDHPAGGVVRAALYYLHLHQPAALGEIARLSEREGRRYLAMDETAVRTLELFASLSGERRGSLLWAVDRTRTPMGARTLRSWLAAPLLDVARIGDRHDAVGELLEGQAARKALSGPLDAMGDLSRLASRLAQDRSGPRDVAALRDSLAAIPALSAALGDPYSKLLSELRERLGDHREAVRKIDSALADEVPAGYREGGIFRKGYDPRVDELTHLLTHGKGMLAEMEARERQRTGIGTLKVGYNRVFGYYLEVSKPHIDKVPQDYIRKQTLVNAERFITPELKEFESKVLRAQEERNAREEELFLALRENLKRHLPAVYLAADGVAELDALLSFAELAATGGYGRPKVHAGRDIVIENGRHPVVERIMGRHAFVPNDCRLSPDGARLAIVTGPNMAGKSTYIRQVALIVLLAHAGSYVPADRAEIGAVDRIFTRIGASDDLSRGESTFMVEMRETARILSGITDRTLVVLDEVGRGTSTYDGLSIAWAVAEHLHDAPARPKVLFATHFHELTDIVSTSPNARNYHVAVREWQGDIIFLRRIDEGSASKSYGIQVARLAGLPDSLIDRARDILKNLESAEYNEFGLPSLAGARATQRVDAAQMELFAGRRERMEEEGVLEEIRRSEPERLSPLDALMRLAAWKERLRKGPP